MLAALIPLALAALAGALPPDRAAVIATARAAVERQDNAAAIAALEAERARNADDPEILRLLGTAYGYAHRYPEALATLARAEALAPADLDIKAAAARVNLWAGNIDAARRQVKAIEARDSMNADARDIRRQIDARSVPDGPTHRIGIALAQSVASVRFAGGRQRTWSSTTFAAFGDVAPGTTLTLDADREDRETAIDTRLEARIDQRIDKGLTAHVAIAGTPNADFRERLSVAAGIEATVTPGLSLLADIRHADYGSVTATAFEPGARLTLRRAGLSATARMINLWDERGTHRIGVSGRIDKAFADGATLYAGAASYPDTEAGITRRADAAYIGGTMPIAERLTLRAGLDYTRRRSSYTRKGASLGLQLRF